MGVQGWLPKRRNKKCLNLDQAPCGAFPWAAIRRQPHSMKFGTLQDVSLDISGDVKQLYGQKQFPEAVARGKCKITGKSKFAAINGKMLNDLFFGQTMPAGMKQVSLDESHPSLPRLSR